GRELAGQLGGGQRLSERCGLSRPHRAEAIFTLPFRRRPDRRERGAGERIGRGFAADRAEFVGEAAAKSAREAAGHQVGEQGMAALEPPAMSVADRSLGCVQVRGPKLDRARTKDKGRGDPAAIRYSARGDDRNGYSVDDLRYEPEQTHGFGRITLQEAAGVATRLE